MKAFDTDVLTLVMEGDPAFLSRISALSDEEQGVPIVVAEEILRGRLGFIRQAESGKTKATIDQAYQLLEETLAAFRSFRFLEFTSAAESLFQEWRQKKIRGSTHDLRIAACSKVHGATLVSRNRRDFERVPGLSVEFWD